MASRLSLETIVSMKDEYSHAAKRVQSAARNMGSEMERAHNIAKHPIRHAVGKGLGSAWEGLKGVASSFSGESSGGDGEGGKQKGWIQKIVGFMGSAVRGTIAILKPLTIAFAGASVALAGFGFAASKVAAEHEALRMSLIAIAGSAEVADDQIRRLREVARLPGLGFEEAIKGSARLQSVGFDARLAERAMTAFGNALALSGGGKEQLDGVLLALQQIASKGTVSAEEILQIAERVPQIRKAMQAAFGTADTEALQKMGITAKEFIPAIIDELSKLPKVTGGAKNAFENLSDAARVAMASIGRVINDLFAPAVAKLGDFVNYLSDSGILAFITQEFIKAGSAAVSASAAAGKAGLAGAKGAGQLLDNVFNLTSVKTLAEFGTKAFDFVSQSKDAGEFLVRAGSLLAATFAELPTIATQVLGFVTHSFEKIRLTIEHLVKKITGISFFGIPVFAGTEESEEEYINRVGDSTRAIYLAEKELAKSGDRIMSMAGQIAEGFMQSKPSEEVANDPSRGSLETNTARTAKATESLLQLERRKADIVDRIIGGGSVGGEKLNKVNLSRYQRGSGPVSRSSSDIERLIRMTVDALAEHKVSGIVDSKRLNWGR